MGKDKSSKKAKAVGKETKLKPKQRLKLVLGETRYKELKKKCCTPKHPHCKGCPILKAFARETSQADTGK